MRSILLTLVFLVALAACAPAPEVYDQNAPTPYNVVLVTLDGVRLHELFDGEDGRLTRNPTPIFDALHQQLLPRGRLYGDPRDRSEVKTGSTMNGTLPSFTALYAESPQGCFDNLCERVKVTTFLDRLHDELGLSRDDLAVYGAWPRLDRAVTGRDDVATVVTRNAYEGTISEHPEAALVDASMEWDPATVVDAFAALARHPRYLHIALVDSDRFGHRGDYARHTTVLRAYDRLLAELSARLSAAGEWEQNTALIVATDHGRGFGEGWKDHGPLVTESSGVWVFVMLPPAAKSLALVPVDARTFDHHDVRFTIETLFGLSTAARVGHSTGFVELTR